MFHGVCPTCALANRLNVTWNSGADGDGAATTTPLHPPTTSTRAQQRQEEAPNAQSGAATAMDEEEPIAATPCRRQVGTADDHSHADARGIEEEGWRSDWRRDDDRGVKVTRSRQERKGLSVMGRGPNGDAVMDSVGSCEGREGYDCARTHSLATKSTATGPEPRVRWAGRRGRGRGAPHPDQWRPRRGAPERRAHRGRLLRRGADDDALPCRAHTVRHGPLRPGAPGGEHVYKRDPPRRGKPSPMRIGEAANPGPANSGNRSTWGAFAAQDPRAAGFRDALAPGFDIDDVDGASDPLGQEGQDLGMYSLRIVTVNITSWRSVLKFLSTTEADVLLIQEHKLGEEQADEAAEWLRKRGWNSLFAPAEKGPNGGWSAGVAVLARAHVGLSLPPSGTEIVEPARVVAAKVEAPGCRPMVVVSMYLHDGKGLAKCNIDLLGKVGGFLAAQGEGRPFVVGGDMQMPPEDLAHVGLASELSAVLVASRDPRGTCRTARAARELDYFLVSAGLADGIEGVTPIPLTGIKTHLPIQLAFKPRLSSIRALVIRKPPPMATERIIGPVREIVDWSDLERETRQLATDAMDPAFDIDVLRQRLGDSFRQWADLAEEELMESVVDGYAMPRRGLRGRKPVLVWRSILPERGRARDDDDVTRWRCLANAALEVQRLVYDVRAHWGRARQREMPGTYSGVQVTDDDAVQEEGAMHIVWATREQLHAQMTAVLEEIDAIAQDFGGRASGSQHEVEQLGHTLAKGVEDVVGRLRQGAPSEGRHLDDEIHRIRTAIGTKVEELAERERARHIDSWTRWMRAGIDAGARNAHRYTRLPPQWRPQPMRTADGILSADPGQTIAAYRAKYVKRWNGPTAGPEEQRPRASAPWYDAPRCHLPRPTVKEIRDSANSFPHDTAVSFDGIAMRHYGLITDQGLETLSFIVIAMEAIGRLPPQLEALIMPLLGKERGGHRAITTAPSLYRLWGHLRRGESQRWEAKYDRPYFAAGKGRRVQDVLWRQAVRAEAGDGAQLASAAILWDKASYYDSMKRKRLWRMAVKHQFPMVIARLAFATYDAPRALTLAGRLSCPTFARDGVPAGCPFASAFSRLYGVDAFDTFVESDAMRDDGEADFDAYVDDLVISATGTEQEVVRTLVGAAGVLRELVEGELACDIELDKASVVASNANIARQIARKLGAYAGKGGGVASTVNLGCDYAPGRRRTAHRCSGKRASRFAALLKRGRRLARARRAIGGYKRSRKVFTTGLLPAAVPDAAVNGVSDREALTLRRVAAMACTPRARGRSLALTTLLHKAPSWRAEVEVVLQYARQVWAAVLLGPAKPRNGGFSLAGIAEKWRATNKEAIFSGQRRDQDAHARDADDAHIADHSFTPPGRAAAAPPAPSTRKEDKMWMTDGRRREWQEVRGPIGAAILSLHRIGWQMHSPFILTDDRGEELPLTKVSPAMLSTLLYDAVLRSLERCVGAKLAEGDEEYSGRRICIDHVRRQLASDRGITHEGRAAFISVLCGAVMTFSRAVSLGYLVDDICPKCGCRGDTVRHRVWECQHADVVAARNRAAPRWLREEVARRPVSQTRWTNGLVPHPGDVWPRPAQEAAPQAIYDGPGDPPIDEGSGLPSLVGRVYVDGSCSQHVVSELKRAATAIVIRDAEVGTLWRIRMPVPTPMPQTSQSAEHVALPMLQAYLRGTSSAWDVASDCASVVRACGEPVHRAIGSTRVYGGLLKTVLCDVEWSRRVTVRKVAAHVNADALEGEAKEDALGNEAADREAKLARDMHPQPTPSQCQDLESELKRARAVVRTIAATMPLFPPMPRERMQRRPVARDGAVLRGRGGHEWEYRAGSWRCSICWALTIKADISAELAHRRCGGPKQSLMAEAITRRGHRLAYAEGDLGIMFCWDCGAFSARRAYGLGAACRGTPTPAGAQALARIRRGEQPWQDRRDKERRRAKIGSAAAWSRAKASFVRPDGEQMQHGQSGAAIAPDTQLQASSTARKRAMPCCADEPPLDGYPGDAPRDEDDQWDGDGRRDDTDMAIVDDDRTPWDEPQWPVFEAMGDEGDIFDHGASLDQHEEHVRVSGDPSWSSCGGGQVAGVSTSDQTHDGARRSELSGERGTQADMTIPHQPPVGQGSQGAEANGTEICAVGAREGPGGPPPLHATAAVATSHPTVVTAAVVGGGDGAAQPQRHTTSRGAPTSRGKAAPGPPSGRAEPLDSSWNTVKRRRLLNFPLSTPTSPEAGSGNDWHALGDEDGMSQPGVVRRRDGTDSPARTGAAARHGDVAAVPRGRGPPETTGGSADRVQLARQSECQQLPWGKEAEGDGGDGGDPRRHDGKADVGHGKRSWGDHGADDGGALGGVTAANGASSGTADPTDEGAAGERDDDVFGTASGTAGQTDRGSHDGDDLDDRRRENLPRTRGGGRRVDGNVRDEAEEDTSNARQVRRRLAVHQQPPISEDQDQGVAGGSAEEQTVATANGGGAAAAHPATCGEVGINDSHVPRPNASCLQDAGKDPRGRKLDQVGGKATAEPLDIAGPRGRDHPTQLVVRAGRDRGHAGPAELRGRQELDDEEHLHVDAGHGDQGSVADARQRRLRPLHLGAAQGPTVRRLRSHGSSEGGGEAHGGGGHPRDERGGLNYGGTGNPSILDQGMDWVVAGAGRSSLPQPLRRAAGQTPPADCGRDDAEPQTQRRKRPRHEGAHGHDPGPRAGGPSPSAAGGGGATVGSRVLFPWQRPPAWLYLPSQGVHGHGHAEQIVEGADTAEDGDAELRSIGIRGRLPTPGRGGMEAVAVHSFADDDSRNEGLAERAVASTGASAAGSSRTNGGVAVAEARGADAYIMRAYLERHRERVKKRQEMDQSSGDQPQASAAERLAALRRRVTARRAAADRPAAAANVEIAMRIDREGPMEEEPRRACMTSPGAPTSSEDGKMHLGLGDDSWNDPAEHRVSTTAADAGGGTDGAADAEARRAAWHSVGAALSAPP